jgi:hypothetical protein
VKGENALPRVLQKISNAKEPLRNRAAVDTAMTHLKVIVVLKLRAIGVANAMRERSAARAVQALAPAAQAKEAKEARKEAMDHRAQREVIPAPQAIPSPEVAARAVPNVLIHGPTKAVNARVIAAAHQVTVNHIRALLMEAANVPILAVRREESASHTTAAHQVTANPILDHPTQERNALILAAKRVENAKPMAAARLAIASLILARLPAKENLTLALKKAVNANPMAARRKVQAPKDHTHVVRRMVNAAHSIVRIAISNRAHAKRLEMRVMQNQEAADRLRCA